MIGRRVLIVLAPVLLAAHPAATQEICREGTPSSEQNPSFECPIQSAFAAAFDSLGRPQPKVTRNPGQIRVDADGSVDFSYVYEMALFDNTVFRSLQRDETAFAASAKEFSRLLKEELCAGSLWQEEKNWVWNITITLRLDAAPDINSAEGFPTDLRSLTSCEAP